MYKIKQKNAIKLWTELKAFLSSCVIHTNAEGY